MTSIRFGGRWLRGSQVIDIPQGNSGGSTIPPKEHLGFVYAPTIIHTTSPPDTTPRYYMYFCMADYHRKDASDQMGFCTSFDGINWSTPKVILHVTNNDNGQKEGATCDPSVVHFEGSGLPDVDGYYYLFYSGNVPGFQTVMFVARSTSLYGPFDKYCGRDQRGKPIWGGNEPEVIIYPKKTPVPAGWYGAGEQSVVVTPYPDGVQKFYSWHCDDSETHPLTRTVYFSTSLNAIDWSVPIKTNVVATSMDVKLDAMSGIFHMYYVAPRELRLGTFLAHRESRDGIRWGPEEELCAPYAFPEFAHNVGVTGNPAGHLLSYSLVGYGAPGHDNVDEIFSTSQNNKPWDLYYHVIGDSKTFDRGYFTFPSVGPVGTFFSDGENWVAFLTSQDYRDHKSENPRNTEQNLGVRSHTQIGTFIGPWHSGMPIPP